MVELRGSNDIIKYGLILPFSQLSFLAIPFSGSLLSWCRAGCKPSSFYAGDRGRSGNVTSPSPHSYRGRARAGTGLPELLCGLSRQPPLEGRGMEKEASFWACVFVLFLFFSQEDFVSLCGRGRGNKGGTIMLE